MIWTVKRELSKHHRSGVLCSSLTNSVACFSSSSNGNRNAPLQQISKLESRFVCFALFGCRAGTARRPFARFPSHAHTQHTHTHSHVQAPRVVPLLAHHHTRTHSHSHTHTHAGTTRCSFAHPKTLARSLSHSTHTHTHTHTRAGAAHRPVACSPPHTHAHAHTLTHIGRPGLHDWGTPATQLLTVFTQYPVPQVVLPSDSSVAPSQSLSAPSHVSGVGDPATQV